MKDWYKFKVTESIGYLRIDLTENMEDLKKRILEKIKKELKDKLENSKILKLSLFGRIALCKMKILPKFVVVVVLDDSP